MTTMKDVARLAGVSAKTVSRVFNDNDYVSADVRERVAQAMQQLNYLPNMAARSFRAGKAPLLAVAVPDLADPFFAEIIQAIDQDAKVHDYVLAVTSLGTDPSREQAIVEALLEHQAGGLIVAPISADQSYLAKWLTQTTVVFVDREPRRLSADLFVEDDRAGARMAVEHLLTRGHRRIAFVGDSDEVVTTHRRLEGYREAIAMGGMTASSELLLWGEPAEARELVVGVLGSEEPPTAILSSNSRTAVEIFATLQQLGRKDVALVSFGDFPMASVLSPSVTVVDQDPSRLGHAAAERLFARLQHPKRRFRRRNVLDVRLVERESSGPPVRDPDRDAQSKVESLVASGRLA